ncbi:Aminopeptidase N-like, N-terminal domain, partial [Dillenia turbinata]
MEQLKGQTRLPKFAVPKRYDLSLKVDLSACTFTGSVQIDLRIVEETKFIVLNALELDINEVCFIDAQNQKHCSSHVVLVPEDEILVLVFDNELGVGDGILGIDFSAALNKHLKGFYKGYKKGSAVVRMLQDYLGDDIFRSQFMFSGLHGDSERQWIVPINLRVSSYEQRSNFLLETKQGNFDLSELLHASDKNQEQCNNHLWVKVNMEQAGFYRVKYDDELASRLRKAVENNWLSASDKKLGWEPIFGESHLSALARGEVLMALATLGHKKTQEAALERFQVFLADRDTPLLSSDTRRAAYVTVMRKSSIENRSGFDALLNVYQEADVVQERTRVLRSLASSPDPNLVVESLNLLLSGEIREQDAIYVLTGISLEGREAAWGWFKENWDLILKKWGDGMLLTHFIRDMILPVSY